MNRGDYYRNHRQLVLRHSVTFAKQSDLVDFVAMFVGKMYSDYITDKLLHFGITEEDRRRYIQRMSSEIPMAEKATREYLNGELKKMDTFWNKIKAKFKRNGWPRELRFDTKDNDELFKYVLCKIGQGDTPQRVFEANVTYAIKLSKTLIRQIEF